MTQEKTKDLLSVLFTATDGRIHFSDDCFNKEKVPELNGVYEKVSDIMRDSGLTHGFSYEIASRAVDILIELEDWGDDDAQAEFSEMVDSAVPVYTSELMTIYEANSWAVDEAAAEMGGEGDSVEHAKRGWYFLIEAMVTDLAIALTDNE